MALLAGVRYVPLLRSRIAEVQAFRELDGPTKAKTFPIFALRPWPNAKRLEKAVDKIVEAAGGNRFALDLDPSKFSLGSASGAQGQFNDLFDAAGDFRAYYELVESVALAAPVAQCEDGEFTQLAGQRARIEAIGKGVFIRIRPNSIRWMDAIKQFSSFDEAVYIIDAGWVKDLTAMQAWASRVIIAILDENPESELVIAASTFPDEFTRMGEKRVYPINERFWFNDLVRRHNIAHSYFGDWGSTRQDRDPVPMNPVVRIDVPLGQEWVAFRQSANESSYQEVAARAVGDTIWRDDPPIWGANLIKGTAEGMGLIKNQAKAAAARVNIHLFQQANFGEDPSRIETNERYVDDL